MHKFLDFGYNYISRLLPRLGLTTLSDLGNLPISDKVSKFMLRASGANFIEIRNFPISDKDSRAWGYPFTSIIVFNNTGKSPAFFANLGLTNLAKKFLGTKLLNLCRQCPRLSASAVNATRRHRRA
jgi:hypothetical protein